MKANVYNLTKALIFLMAFAVLTVLTVLIPEIIREESVGKINPPNPLPVYIISWIYSLPIFYAILQTLKLIKLIEIKKAFSFSSIAYLQKIKLSALTFLVMVIAGVALGSFWVKSIDPTEDITPLITFGVIFTFIPSVIAAFVATVIRLLQNAIDIKSENELTV